MWLACGCMMYIPCVFVSGVLLNTKQGLRLTTLLGSTLCCVSASGRCLALFWPKSWVAIAIITAGQCINGAVGPLVLASPSKLSSTWFPQHQRTTATAIAFLCNSGGSALGFVVGPYFVRATSLPVLLIVESIVGLVIMLWSFVYFPERPPTPPTPSSAVTTTENVAATSPLDFFRNVPRIVTNVPFLLLVFVGGWQAGTFNSWSGSFEVILSPLHYTQTTCGWLGFCATLASMTGGLIVGLLADRLFRGRFKLLLLLLFTLSTTSFMWFTLSLPSLFADHGVIPGNEYTTYVAVALGGLFLGSTNPLFYELAAELTFPVPEEVSAVFMTLVMNIICVVILFGEPLINYNYINALVTLSIIGCGAVLLLVRERYPRLELDRAQQKQRAVGVNIEDPERNKHED
eukprot:TRINITY_DN2011_c0_g1_i1.p2 TRINITY_DN2011_c0_g1~~TRINITY_DN2011_c0_g1_i1.p2  ORF type:complete len:403 (+),score=102.26 TRINITY_DN2011_c0_g1_i1:210-1418(+)